MSQTPTARRWIRSTFGSAAFCLVVLAAVIGAVADQPASSTPTSSSPGPGEHTGTTIAAGGAHGLDVTVLEEAPAADLPPPGAPPSGIDHGGATLAAGGAVSVADGVLPDGVTVFDDEYPGVANLDLALLEALRAAAADAADDGVTFTVNSGWRSWAHQDRLFREAIVEYGSAEEAARWVATSDTSAHVSGDAADIGPSEAQAWLSENGAAHGLCQVYANEPWHFELRRQATDRGCPRMYADPTEDPRTEP